MALSKKDEQKVTSKVFGLLGMVVGVVLLFSGVACWQVGTSTVNAVNKALTDQKLYFPPAGSPAFSAQAFPNAQKYAGKQVVNGTLAKAFADDYVSVQMKALGQGKTLSEVTAAAAASPTDVVTQKVQETMFQLETLRGSLLVNGYGATMQATMIRNLGAVELGLGAVALLFGLAQLARYKKL